MEPSSDRELRGDGQRVDDAQRLVHGAMEKTMQVRGLRTARALTQALNEHGYAVGERTVTGWRRRESAIPAWALVAFGEISEIGLDALMGVEDTTSLAEAVARHDRILGEMQATLIEISDKVGVLWHPSSNELDVRQEHATG